MNPRYYLIAATLLLTGCQAIGPLESQQTAAPEPARKEPAAAPAKPKEAAPAPAEIPQARKDLNAGIEMYKAGNYNGAIKLLASPSIDSADTALQLEALKHLAFSYCVTGRKTLCRQQFAKAFKLDKAFNLAAGEKGHPLWTPAFERARKEANKKK